MVKLLIASTLEVTPRSFLLPLVAYFRLKGWRVDCMANGVSASAECRTAFDQVYEAKWTRRPLNILRNLAAVRDVQSLVRQQQYDLVHVHTPVAGFLSRFALRHFREQPLGPKLIYTAHGFHFHARGSRYSNFVFEFLERVAGLWTDALLVINREDEQKARSLGIVDSDKIYYVPGVGIDLMKYSPEAVAAKDINYLKQELKLPPSAKAFLMIAEFNPGKRHCDVLRALRVINRTDVIILFAGDGKRLKEIRQISSSMGLESKVRFLGYRKDIVRLIRASEAVLLPSVREGLPRSIMEALALETPVIGTNIRGVRDLVDDRCGFLIEIGDVYGLAQAIQAIVDSPEKARKMGKLGREKMQRFDVRLINHQHDQIYGELLSGKIRVEQFGSCGITRPSMLE